MSALFDAIQQRALVAAINRIIPADDYPVANDAGVANFIHRQLTGDLRDQATRFCHGLTALDAEAAARFGHPLADLSADQQDQVLAAIERGDLLTQWPLPPARFFDRLVNLTAEGYYADPGNGGNQGAVSWKMLDYDPARPTGSPS